MTDEERKRVYLDAWLEANNTPGGRDAHVEGLRAVYNTGLTRAAEIARRQDYGDKLPASTDGDRASDARARMIAAAIDAEKEKK